MNIAEKLTELINKLTVVIGKQTTVAENEQKVYDAGISKGVANKQAEIDAIDAALDGILAIQERLMLTFITFYIEGTGHKAIEGMTWAEWCDSEYNTVGGYVSPVMGDTVLVMEPANLHVVKSDGEYVVGADTIVAGHAYELR